MTIRKSSIALLIVGILLITASMIVKFVMLPSMLKLPADLSKSQKYEGTISALNPEAFSNQDLAHLITPEAPIKADRSLTVDAVDGDTAIITSDTTIELPNGSQMKDVHSYSVSRTDYAPVPLTQEKAQSLVPTNRMSTYQKHEGIAFSFPMNPSKDGNRIYDPVTQTGQDATFLDEGTLEGRDVYNYQVRASGPITSPTVLAQFKNFPPQLSRSVLASLLQAGIVPEASRAAVQDHLSSLPDLIDTGFGSSNVANMAVDKQFGTPLKVDQTQAMFVTVPISGNAVPVLPLSTVKLHTSANEVSALAKDLSKNSTLLTVSGVWLPIGSALVGLLLIVLSIARWRRQVVKTASLPASQHAEGAAINAKQ
ncbi:porin PorA family protein [Nocardia sp. NPDC004123]